MATAHAHAGGAVHVDAQTLNVYWACNLLYVGQVHGDASVEATATGSGPGQKSGLLQYSDIMGRIKQAPPRLPQN